MVGEPALGVLAFHHWAVLTVVCACARARTKRAAQPGVAGLRILRPCTNDSLSHNEPGGAQASAERLATSRLGLGNGITISLGAARVPSLLTEPFLT